MGLDPPLRAMSPPHARCGEQCGDGKGSAPPAVAEAPPVQVGGQQPPTSPRLFRDWQKLPKLAGKPVPLLKKAIDPKEAWQLHYNIHLVQHMLSSALPQLVSLHEAGFSHNAIRPRSFSYYASAKHGQSPVQLENWSVAGPSPAAPNSSTAALVLLSLQSSSRPWNYIMCLPPEALLRIMLSRGVTLSDVATWLRPSGDIFSLGLTMWCILTKGSTPKGGTPETPCVLDGRLRRHPGMLAAHRLKQMRERKLSEDPVWGRLPWDLQRMLTWMLEKSPGRRATARQLMECSFVRRSVLGLPDHPPMPMPKAAPNPPQQPPATANTRQTQTASQATTSSSKPAEPVRYPWEQRIWEHPDWWVVPKTEADALVVVRIDPRRHYAPKVSRKKKMPRLQVCKEKCSQAVTKVGGQLSAAWKRVVTPCMQSLQLGLVGRMPSIDGDMAVPKGKWYLMRGTIWRLLLKPVS